MRRTGSERRRRRPGYSRARLARADTGRATAAPGQKTAAMASFTTATLSAVGRLSTSEKMRPVTSRSPRASKKDGSTALTKGTRAAAGGSSSTEKTVRVTPLQWRPLGQRHGSYARHSAQPILDAPMNRVLLVGAAIVGQVRPHDQHGDSAATPRSRWVAWRMLATKRSVPTTSGTDSATWSTTNPPRTTVDSPPRAAWRPGASVRAFVRLIAGASPRTKRRRGTGHDGDRDQPSVGARGGPPQLPGRNSRADETAERSVRRRAPRRRRSMARSSAWSDQFSREPPPGRAERRLHRELRRPVGVRRGSAGCRRCRTAIEQDQHADAGRGDAARCPSDVRRGACARGRFAEDDAIGGTPAVLEPVPCERPGTPGWHARSARCQIGAGTQPGQGQETGVTVRRSSASP